MPMLSMAAIATCDGLTRSPAASAWMLTAGVPLTTVSRHLGHENVAVTADLYGDVDRAAFKAAADTMAKLLG